MKRAVDLALSLSHKQSPGEYCPQMMGEAETEQQ
jgi:hypothetical protein